MGTKTNKQRIMTRNPNTGRDDVRIAVEIFEPVRDAILGALGEFGQLRTSELTNHVELRTSEELWKGASTIWFTTTVKLHLEAEGLIERSGSPQVVTLTRKGRTATELLD